MENKTWIIIIVLLPIMLFLSYGFFVAPEIFNEGGSINGVYSEYIEEPSRDYLGLGDDEIEKYVRNYIWDLYIILFAVLLILLTDVSFSDFGFDLSEIKKDAIIGILFFLVDLVLLGLVIYVTTSYIPEQVLDYHLSISDITGYAASGELTPSGLNIQFLLLNFFLYFFFVGPAEEVFRLFLLIKLEKVSNLFVAVVLSAFLFGIMHMFGSVFQSLNAFIGGLAYNLLWLFRGRKILAPIIAHGFYDFMITLLPFFK